jgi:tight adherence protein C
VSRAGGLAKRVTPLDTRDRIARKLVLAGQPAGWDAERVLAFKVILAIAGFVGAIIVLRLIDLSPLLQIVCVGLLTFVGFILPDSLLSSRVDDRKKEILRTLSDTLDLLTISVEAGLSLNAAMAQVVKNVPGVLSSEFARMLQEIQLGVPRSEAFRHLAERTDVEELNGFALAMIQADIFGVSIASVLRTQAVQLRIKRRQAIEAKAQQTPVKIVFPLILCILPALFVVIVGPGAIRIFEGFIQT